jgi:hypothetical protein
VDWWIEPFLLGFQQRALVGGLVAAATCSIVGVWLVLRGMSFFGDAFVHGVLPGHRRRGHLRLQPLPGSRRGGAGHGREASS